jgi:hypothetical protein
MDAEERLKRMAPSALAEGCKLGAANLIYGVPMDRDTAILYGLVILELIERYELYVVRESN